MNCSHIVVVEDNDSIREVLSLALELEGYKVVSFRNGQEALDGLAGVATPCLILLDLMMPVMGGLEFLEKRLASGDLVIGIPVIIVSANCESAAQAKYSQLVQGMVKKPIDLEILYQIVKKYCGQGGRGVVAA